MQSSTAEPSWDPSRSGQDNTILPDLLKDASYALLEQGDLANARMAYEQAARLALQEGDFQALGRAALGLGGIWVHEQRTAIEGARIQSCQERALQGLDEADSLAVRLRLRRLAEQEYLRGTCEEILLFVEQARDLGNPVVLSEALSLAHHCMLAPVDASARLDIANELLSVAGLTGRRIDAVMGLLWRTVDLLLVGDPHAGRSLRELTALTARTGMGAIAFVLEAIDVMQIIRRGDLQRAEAAAAACAQRGFEVGDVDAAGWFAAQMVAIRTFQGRMAELAPMLEQMANSPTLAHPDDSLYAALAIAAAQAGDRDGALSALQRLRGDGLGRVRLSSTWLVTLAGVVEAAAIIGESDLAAEAYDLLLPFADMPTMASLGVVCFGSTELWLGVAAMATGRVERAIGHFRSAVVRNEALGHWPARDLSQKHLEQAIQSAENTATGSASCTREGRFWLVSLGPRSVRLPDGVGVRYLAQLIAHPGQEMAAAELIGPSGALPPGQPLLDDTAKREYERRIRELQRIVEEADVTGDAAGQIKAQDELDALLAELRTATGLGGRVRPFNSERELARTSVQKAIRRALGQVAQQDPSIAQALTRDVTTGNLCSYRPGT